jgi:hypothetical protein
MTTSTYKIGDLFTSLKSGVTGTIQEIEVVRADLVRVRLLVDGKDRWTTWTPTSITTKYSNSPRQ